MAYVQLSPAFLSPPVLRSGSSRRAQLGKAVACRPSEPPRCCQPLPSPAAIVAPDTQSSSLLNLATPLLSAVERESSSVRANFFCPGHKRGAGASPPLKALVGELALQHDVPELPALDNLFNPEGVIQEAQILATETFIEVGASQAGWSTFFLVNGSTCGVEAAILSCVRPGRTVLLPRNVHQSAIHALVLSGAVPVWLDPVYDSSHDILHGVTVQMVRTALEENLGSVDAILVVSPTYHGVCSDLQAIAQVAHARDIPFMVDEAHGAHFTFHPFLPATAASCGADIVVQSTHKTLGAMTQSAMLHVRTSSVVSASRVASALQLVQSTSPSYLLLSSLDATRSDMACNGERLMKNAIDLASTASRRISAMDGFSVLDRSSTSCKLFDVDATRMTVFLPRQVSGYDLDEHLIARFGIYAELPAFRHITFIFTPGNSLADVDTLVTGMALFHATMEPSRPTAAAFSTPSVVGRRRGPGTMTPRDAFFAPSQSVPRDQAVGRVSADTLCPYPPGVPVLVPGEIITEDCVAYLLSVLQAGGSVTGAADDALSTVRVIV